MVPLQIDCSARERLQPHESVKRTTAVVLQKKYTALCIRNHKRRLAERLAQLHTMLDDGLGQDHHHRIDHGFRRHSGNLDSDLVRCHPD